MKKIVYLILVILVSTFVFSSQSIMPTNIIIRNTNTTILNIIYNTSNASFSSIVNAYGFSINGTPITFGGGGNTSFNQTLTDATYLKQDGTTPLSGNWNYGAFNISGSGNMGIGTVPTNYKLDVNGSVNITSNLTVGNLNLHGNNSVITQGRAILFSTLSPEGVAWKNIFIGQAGNVILHNDTLPYEASGNVGIGFEALEALTHGYYNFALGTQALNALTTGNSNVAIGNNAGGTLTTGTTNTYIGRSAGYANSGSSNIMIGYYAGRYSTEGNTLILDNQPRGDVTGEKKSALIFGKFDINPNKQNLTINGNLFVSRNFTFENESSQIKVANYSGAGNAFLSVDSTGLIYRNEVGASDTSLFIKNNTDVQLNNGLFNHISIGETYSGIYLIETPYYSTSELNYINTPYFSSGYSTNYLLQTEDFTSASWYKRNVTVTSNVISDPSNQSTTAERVYTSVKGVDKSYYNLGVINQSFADTSITNWTCTVYAKTLMNTINTTIGLSIGTNSSWAGNGSYRNFTITSDWDDYSVTQNISYDHARVVFNIFTQNETNISLAWAQCDKSPIRRTYFIAQTTAATYSPQVTRTVIRGPLNAGVTTVASLASAGAISGTTISGSSGTFSGVLQANGNISLMWNRILNASFYYTPNQYHFYLNYTNTTGEVMNISTNGIVQIKNLTGTGNDYVCVDSTGRLYRSDLACI